MIGLADMERIAADPALTVRERNAGISALLREHGAVPRRFWSSGTETAI
jgi:hypothetical protein